jgi:hypothetical protein
MRFGVSAATAVLSMLLSACSGNSDISQPSQYATLGYKEAPGRFYVLNQHCYFSQNLPNLSNDEVDVVLNRLYNANWQNAYKTDGSCPDYNQSISANDFFSTSGNFDAIWYSGHGVQGSLTFRDYDDSVPCSSYQDRCFANNDSRLPFTDSRLKWIFTNASESAVADNPSDSRAWTRAFRSNGVGLHGWYGYKHHPSDIGAKQLANAFFDAELQTTSNPNPVPIRSAWISGARANGRGGDYGIFELAMASDDLLSGPTNPAPYNTTPAGPTNQINYFSGDANTFQIMPLQTSLSTQSTGRYVAVNLTPETWGDSQIATAADQRESGSQKYYQSSNEYRVVSKSYSGQHYETTGTLIAVAPMSTYPFASSRDAAQSWAASQVSGNEGMPGDATLAEVDTHYMDTGSGPSIVGYDFIWRHSSGMVGGDRIVVGVDNFENDVCTHWTSYYDPEIHGRTVECDTYSTSYKMHINYHYRLWRSSGAGRHPLSVDPPLASSQTAFNAAMAQADAKGVPADIGSFVGYTQTYWSTPFDSTDNSAYPAYNFVFSSGYVIHADASSGQILGTSHAY